VIGCHVTYFRVYNSRSRPQSNTSFLLLEFSSEPAYVCLCFAYHIIGDLRREVGAISLHTIAIQTYFSRKLSYEVLAIGKGKALHRCRPRSPSNRQTILGKPYNCLGTRVHEVLAIGKRSSESPITV
jgi:hypothetical protein